jgi:hypothetical protein
MIATNPHPGDSITDDTGTRSTVVSVTPKAVRFVETYTDGSEARISVDRKSWRRRCDDVAARLAMAST